MVHRMTTWIYNHNIKQYDTLLSLSYSGDGGRDDGKIIAYGGRTVVRRHDHSYYFIQTVIDDHIEHHWRMAQMG